MPEGEAIAVADDDVVALRLVEGVVGGHGRPLERHGDGARAALVRRGQEQQGPACAGRQAGQLRIEERVEVSADRQDVGERCDPLPLRRREHRGHLEQGQRVASQPADQVPDDGAGEIRCQELLSLRDGEVPDGHDVDAVERRGPTRSPGEDEGDAVVVHAAGGEEQRGGRFGIDPLDVVEQDQHRGVLGGRGEEREGARADEEAVAGFDDRSPAEGGGERGRLRPRDVVQMGANRGEQFEQAGVREGRLGLDPARGEARELLGACRRGLQQPRLPDAALALEREHPRPAAAGVLQQPVDAFEFGSAPDHPPVQARLIEGFPRRERLTGGPRLPRWTNIGRTP